MTAKPLSKHMLAALNELARVSKPSQQFNPGVVHALYERALVQQSWGPAIRKGARTDEQIQYLRITPAGMRAIGAAK